MGSAVILPVVLPASMCAVAEQRLALQGEIMQFFPEARVKIILQGDGIPIEGMEARFAAFIVGNGSNQGKKAKLNAETPEGLIDRSKEVAFQWQNDSAQPA